MDSAIPDDSAGAAALDVAEENELIRFEKADEFLSLLDVLLQPIPTQSGQESSGQPSRDNPQDTLTALTSILDEYQEQSYLLDPYLDQIVRPPISALQTHIRSSNIGHEAERIVLLSRLVYFYTKIRGHKTITNFFPHEVADLSPTLSLLESIADGQESDPILSASWELRYVLLLWLSLVCMIPFDLHQFDHQGSSKARATAIRLENIGRHFIDSPGKERDAAAILLGKLFQRRDVHDAQFEAFTAFCSATLVSKPSAFTATGILQALCEIVKTSDPTFVTSRLPSIQVVLDLYDDPDRQDLSRSGLVTKYQAKLTCRLGLKLLRPRKRRRLIRVKELASNDDATSNAQDEQEDEDEDVPDVIDTYISSLIQALQHKDTVVRYSAAKGLARLCERLPKSFISQVSDAVVSLFHINIPDLYEGANDLSSVSEYTWQGACMALAEQARRGLLFADELGEKLEWIEKALLFDVRRGAHSVGASVRDAACYVVWALARAHDRDAIRPHALSLARKLVAVATLDRDVSIRRAASAAFQECVGRLDLFPRGIDVIRMTDFYAVSVRRNAFQDCAVQVAGFDEYREYLLDHLCSLKVVYWDAAIRNLAAKAIAGVVNIDYDGLANKTIERLEQLCKTRDSTVLHGALLALAEIAFVSAERGEFEYQARCLNALNQVPPNALRTLGAGQVLQSGCALIASGLRLRRAPPDSLPAWEAVLHAALARQEEYVHEAASAALGSASRVVACGALIDTAVDRWATLTPAQQQSYALALGAAHYNSNERRDRVVRLLASLKTPESSVETRRNACASLGRIAASSPSVAGDVVPPLLAGLDDYTADQRGDVGSWIRLASIEALRRTFDETTLPPTLRDAVLGAVLKQSVERIDPLRVAARALLVHLGHPDRPPIESLADPALRRPLLEGILLSLPPDPADLVAYAAEDISIVQDLVQLARDHFTSNRLFVPAMRALAALFEAGVTPPDETITARLLRLASSVARAKSVPRVSACMTAVFNLLPTEPAAITHISAFLAHPFPTARAAASEHLFMVLQMHDIPLPPEGEELLLSTPWLRARPDNFAPEAARIVSFLQTS